MIRVNSENRVHSNRRSIILIVLIVDIGGLLLQYSPYYALVHCAVCDLTTPPLHTCYSNKYRYSKLKEIDRSF